MNTEVIDSFTADSIEVGDLIRIALGGENYLDEITVTSIDDEGSHIIVFGISEITGDGVDYPLHPDQVVFSLGTVSEDI